MKELEGGKKKESRKRERGREIKGLKGKRFKKKKEGGEEV